MRNDPNPVWMREMRQAARLGRTPVILATITGLMALLICSVGGLLSIEVEPAKVGVSLFHTFFSLAFVVVTWVAPAVAASTIASERSGRTWEALLLTGLGSPAIARGKFTASLTYVSLYLVMLAPVGVLPFLFGGVTATEVFTAFVLLFAFAVLSVAFGLSVSSKFSNSAGAVVITLLVAVPLATLGYIFLGPVLSIAVHDLWPAVPSGPPVWLPTAYARADFGAEYLAFLVAVPAVAVALPAWFFYEVTLANMASLSDDRSTRLKRWFLVSGAMLIVASLVAIPAAGPSAALAGVWAMLALAAFVAFSAFVFAGEPLGPSRRVRILWERSGAGRWRRWLGPGVMSAAVMMLVVGLGGTLLLAMVSAGADLLMGGKSAGTGAAVAGVFALYSLGFSAFTVGFLAWTRARAKSAVGPRLLLIVVMFCAAAVPWIFAAIAAIAVEDGDTGMLLGAPSPVYVVVMMKAIDGGGGNAELTLGAGAISAAAWLLLGLGLMLAATVRVRRVVREHVAALARVDAMLEDEQAGEEPPPTSQAGAPGLEPADA